MDPNFIRSNSVAPATAQPQSVPLTAPSMPVAPAPPSSPAPSQPIGFRPVQDIQPAVQQPAQVFASPAVTTSPVVTPQPIPMVEPSRSVVAEQFAPAPAVNPVPAPIRRAWKLGSGLRLVAVCTALILMVTGSAYLFNKGQEPSTGNGDAARGVIVPEQDLSPEATISEVSNELPEAQTLIVNGDIRLQGALNFASGSYLASFVQGNLTGNQTYTLPDASGELCVSSNNCNYVTAAQLVATGLVTQQQLTQAQTTLVTAAQLADLQQQLDGIVVTAPNFSGGAGISIIGDVIQNSGVLTLNGQSGALTLTGGSGILVSGTTLSNSGVLTVNGQNGAVNFVAGTGLSLTGTTFANEGVLSLGGQAGALNLISGPGISISGLTVSNNGVTSTQGLTGNVVFTAGSGIDITGTAVSNTGVTLLAGTTDQISVSAGTGSVTLSLPQNIAVSSTPTFAGMTLTGALTATSITSTAGLTVGSTSQNLTLQGAVGTTLVASNGVNTTTVSFQSPTANVIYRFGAAAAGSYDICTTTGNCSGVGGGVTTPGGTAGTLPKFTSSQGLGDSLVTDNGTTVTVNGDFDVTGVINGQLVSPDAHFTGNVTVDLDMSVGGTLTVNNIAPTGAMTVGDAGQSLLLQGSAVTLSNTNSGITNQLVFATPSGSNKTITIPNLSGTICLTSGNCAGVGGTGDVLQGGNSYGTAMSIGTNDNYSLAFKTNGATAMTILTGGNVGIGTTNPVNGKLELGLPTGDQTAIWINGGTTNRITFGGGIGVIGISGVANFITMNGTNGDLTLQSTTSQNVFLKNGTTSTLTAVGGNVGIGQTTPTNRLHIKATGNSFSNAGIRLEDDSTTNSYDLVFDDRFRIGYNGTTVFTVSSSGDTSIGSSGASARLHVQSGNALLDNTYGLQIRNNANTAINVLSMDSSNHLSLGASSGMGNLNISAGTGTINFGSSTNATLLMLQNDGKLVFGVPGSQDTNIYRSVANTLRTDDNLDVGQSLTVATGLTVTSGSVTIPATADDGTYTGFVTNDSGVLKYRTLAQIRDDIRSNSAISAISPSPSITSGNWYRVAQRTGSAGRMSAIVTITTIGGNYAPNSRRFLVQKDYGTAATVTLLSQNGTSHFDQVRVVDDAVAGNSYVDVRANTTTAPGTIHVTIEPMEMNFNTPSAVSFTDVTVMGVNEVALATLNVGSNTHFGISSAWGGNDIFRIQGSNVYLAGEIIFGGDTNLYRVGANHLRTDDMFSSGGGIIGYRSVATDTALVAYTVGDTHNRLQVLANGTLQFGAGNLAVDVNLYRSAVDTLRTDDDLVAGKSGAGSWGLTLQSDQGVTMGNITGCGYGILSAKRSADTQARFKIQDCGPGGEAGGILLWGAGGSSAPDVNLYRSGANELRTDDAFRVQGDLYGMSSVYSRFGQGDQAGLTVVSGQATLVLGGDTSLYRSAADTLRTDDKVRIVTSDSASAYALYVDNNPASGTPQGIFARTGQNAGNFIYGAGVNSDTAFWGVQGNKQMVWGDGVGAVDTNLYRSAANFLKTDDSLWVQGSDISGTRATVIRLGAMSDSTSSPLFKIDVADATDELFMHSERWSSQFTWSRSSSTGNKSSATLVHSGSASYFDLFSGDETANNVRIRLNAGGAAANPKLEFADTAGNVDTNLYRSAANTLKTDDSLIIAASGSTALQVQNAAGTALLTANTTTMRLGIGVTTPSAKLEVAGEYTPAGINWTARTGATGLDNLTSVAYGNGMFVAVDEGGGANSVMTSPDGITWTARSVPEANQWQSVTYGNGLFVAVANTGTNRIMTSPDGITWTARSQPAGTYVMYSVTYGNGLFVATGSTNTTLTSPDGITWTARTPAENNFWYSVTYGNGLFVAVAGNGTNRVMTSPDGITWTARSAAQANTWRSVIYGNGLFVAVANNNGSNLIMTSPDGITWTGRSVTGTNQWFGVTYGGGLFVGVACSYNDNIFCNTSGADRVMTSSDGITWTRRAAVPSEWRAVTYGAGKFVAVANDGTDRVMTSELVVDAPALKVSGEVNLSGYDSTAAFQIQNAAGVALLTADTTNSIVKIATTGNASLSGAALIVTKAEVTTTLRVGDGTNGVEFSGSGAPIYRGTARPTKRIALAPEFAGMVLSASGGSNTGTMTAGYDSTNAHNYYNWTTTQVTNQNYDLVVRIPVPQDYSALTASPQLCMFGYTSDTTNGTLSIVMKDSANATVTLSSASFTPGSTNTWAETCRNITGTPTITAGGWITLVITMQAPQSGNTRVGEVRLDYLGGF